MSHFTSVPSTVSGFSISNSAENAWCAVRSVAPPSRDAISHQATPVHYPAECSILMLYTSHYCAEAKACISKAAPSIKAPPRSSAPLTAVR